MASMDVRLKPASSFTPRMWWLSSVGTVSLVLAGWYLQSPSASRATLQLASVEQGELIRIISGQGQLRASAPVWLVAESGGLLVQLLAKPGTPVTTGQVLLHMKNPALEDELQEQELSAAKQRAETKAALAQLDMELAAAETRQLQATGERDAAELELQAHEALLARGIVARLQVEKMRVRVGQLNQSLETGARNLDSAQRAYQAKQSALSMQLDQLQASKEVLQRKRNALTVRAPQDGVVVRWTSELAEGKAVATGTPLMQLADPHKLYAEIQVQATMADVLQIGQRAQIALADQSVAGHVTRIDPRVDTDMVTVDLAIDGPLPDIARPDLAVSAKLTVGSVRDKLFLPRSENWLANTMQDVYRLNEETKSLDRTAIRLGDVYDNNIVVLEGLAMGDRVVIGGLPRNDVQRYALTN